MENIICKLCAGSPEIDLYKIKLSDKEKEELDKVCDITTDICIGREVKKLVNLGIKTTGCCCGHGEFKPTCLVKNESRELLESIGYELHEFSEEHTNRGTYEIYLKTDVQTELRKVLSNKVFRYLGE